MGAQQTRYSDECKAMIVAFYRNVKTSSAIMSEQGLGKTALDKWVNARREITVETETMTALDSKKFKNRIRKWEEENDILQKARIIFAKR